MKKIPVFGMRLAFAVWLASASWLMGADAPEPVLRDATVLIIRHSEKPETGRTLSPAGERRAAAYPGFFQAYQVDGKPLHFDSIFATADSKGSQRPRLTVEPLAKALGLKIDQRFANKESEALAKEIRTTGSGQSVLVVWHHGKIAPLVKALGGDPAALLPEGQWPVAEFSWVLQLRFDHDGHLIPEQTKRIAEKLMPEDKDLGQ